MKIPCTPVNLAEQAQIDRYCTFQQMTLSEHERRPGLSNHKCCLLVKRKL